MVSKKQQFTYQYQQWRWKRRIGGEKRRMGERGGRRGGRRRDMIRRTQAIGTSYLKNKFSEIIAERRCNIDRKPGGT